MPIHWPTISKLPKNRRHTIVVFLAVLATMVVSACSDDNEPWPAYVYNYADLCTDADGRASSFTLDDGSTFNVTNAVGQLKSDTTLRCVVGYTTTGNGQAEIRQIANVLCMTPRLLTPADTAAQAPIYPQATWRAGKYINLNLTVKGFNGKHHLAIIHDSIAAISSGAQFLHLTLRHSSTEPFEAYSRTIYASCRINQYDDRLVSNRDSVVIHINGTDYRFPY